jgi:O-antigen ligase
MLPALLHTIAFAISLFVQFWSSPLAGAWVFFHIAGCAVLLYKGDYPRDRGVIWYFAVAWLLIIGTSTFILAPVRNGAAMMWVLAAMPSLAVSLRKEHIRPYCICFLTVMTVYALGLVVQLYLNTQTTFINYENRHSWPLLDPNNGAAVINLALLPCLYMALFKDLRWWILCLLFATALYATGSKAGFAVAGLGAVTILTIRKGLDFFLFCMAIGTIFSVVIYIERPELFLILVDSFRDRLPIWEASYPLAFIRPLLGLGLGAFGFYYEKVRIEQYTTGWHAHNDMLQIAIEIGIPAAMILCGLLLSAIFSRANTAASVAILAITAMSMVEFQFYIAAVSLPMGLALGCIMNTRKVRK